MNMEALGLMLDVVVLVCLGATIYFALRLSRSLGAFRENRKKLEELIAALSHNIDQANAAILNLRATGTKQTEKLQELVKESRALFSELQVMNEAGNNLAERLEKATDSKSSRPAPQPGEFTRPEPFLIHDRDFEESAEEDTDWGEEEPLPPELQSQAEKELFRALRKIQKKPPASRRH